MKQTVLLWGQWHFLTGHHSEHSFRTLASKNCACQTILPKGPEDALEVTEKAEKRLGFEPVLWEEGGMKLGMVAFRFLEEYRMHGTQIARRVLLGCLEKCKKRTP